MELHKCAVMMVYVATASSSKTVLLFPFQNIICSICLMQLFKGNVYHH